MLVKSPATGPGRPNIHTPGPRPRRRRRPGTLLVALGVGLLLLSTLPYLPYLWRGTELVRLRHALALGPDFHVQDDWKPPTMPAGYLVELARPEAYFVKIAERLALRDLPDDWARGLAIARHLLGSAPSLKGGAIRDDLRHTYEGIVQGGSGYCGDFVRVFTAIANAAGLQVRPWAFSLDEFGGHGHIFVEVWNRQTLRWQLIDVFQNYTFSEGSSGPLSALEFRQALLSKSAGLRLHAIHDKVPAGWEIEAKAWDYFRRGLDGWFVPWGNNPSTYDTAPPVRMFSGFSRVAEGLGAWMWGVNPPVRMFATTTNQNARAAMRSLGVRLRAGVGVAGLGLILGLAGLTVRLLRRHEELDDRVSAWPRACVVGPLPPPSGGMANQCEQLLRLLAAEGAQVTLVRTNAPYQPSWVASIPIVRAGFRLLPYLLSLWRGIGQAQVVHVFANSGWAWYLLAAPALAIARLRHVPAIVNYRGGLADEFLSHAPRLVHRQLASAAARVTPSVFLQRVFARHGLSAEAIPNVVDLKRFSPQPFRDPLTAPHLVVTRNLEALYDIPTALRTFAQVRLVWPQARLTIAGSGPELAALQQLSAELGLAPAVHFAGRIANADIGGLYAQADLVLNTSTVDNMPNSILESLASGVPVVSTAAGGIPDLVQHEHTAMLAPVGDVDALTQAVLRVLGDRALAWHLRESGLALASQFEWSNVRGRWQAAYRLAAHGVEPA